MLRCGVVGFRGIGGFGGLRGFSLRNWSFGLRVSGWGFRA